MRRLYADFSPGLAWDGREPEALEAATASQLTSRTATLSATGLASLAEIARSLAFLVGGATPAHAPATATITGEVGGVATTEVVTLPTTSAGARRAGAVCSENAWDDTDLEVVYSTGSGTGATVAIGFGLVPGVADLRVIGIEIWLEAFPDRARPGYLNKIQINEIVRDGSSAVDSKLAGNHTVPFDLPPPTEAARAARSMCVASGGELRPTVFVVDHVALRKNAHAELQMLRGAQAELGQSPPGPPLNVGGIVIASGPRTMIDNPDGTSNSGDF